MTKRFVVIGWRDQRVLFFCFDFHFFYIFFSPVLVVASPISISLAGIKEMREEYLVDVLKRLG